MPLFKKRNNTKTYAPLESSNNPYLDNQRGYLERLNEERANTTTWKHIAWFSSLITILAVSGTIYIGSLPSIVPFVFKEDGSGGITALGLANQELQINRQMIAAQVRNFVMALEQVPSSKDLRAENVAKVMNMTTEKSFLTTFAPILRERYKEVGTGEVLIQIKNVLPIQKNSWAVDWVEIKNGHQTNTFKGTLTIEYLKPDYKQNTDQMLYNPLRLIVTDFIANQNIGDNQK